MRTGQLDFIDAVHTYGGEIGKYQDRPACIFLDGSVLYLEPPPPKLPRMRRTH